MENNNMKTWCRAGVPGGYIEIQFKENNEVVKTRSFSTIKRCKEAIAEWMGINYFDVRL